MTRGIRRPIMIFIVCVFIVCGCNQDQNRDSTLETNNSTMWEFYINQTDKNKIYRRSEDGNIIKKN